MFHAGRFAARDDQMYGAGAGFIPDDLGTLGAKAALALFTPVQQNVEAGSIAPKRDRRLQSGLRLFGQQQLGGP